MIIEDEKDLCYLLALHLKKLNVQTSCAHTISEAKKAFSSFDPSIILLDNNLPDGFGTELIPELKSTYPNAIVVMMTAHDHPTVVERAFSNGVDYFISKPFNGASIQNLLETIHLAS